MHSGELAACDNLRVLRTKANKPKAGHALPDQALWAQFQRIGGSLTPVQVSNILREADQGVLTRYCDLLDDSRQKDCHLQSVLGTNEESISGLDWQIAPPEGVKPRSRAGKAAAALEEALRAADVETLLSHHAGAVYYGHAVSEIIWVKSDGLLLPAGFVHHPLRRFGYRQSDGAFVFRPDGAQSNMEVEFEKEWPNKFVVSHPRVNGSVPVREGLGRNLMWAALFRNWDLSDWLKLAEMAWKPWRIGVYQDGANQEEIDELTMLLEKMVSSGVLTHSDREKVEIVWAKGGSGSATGSSGGGGGGGGTHSELFDKMAAEMSKAVLGQTLTTDQGRVGSQALGRVQDGVRKERRDSRARYIAGRVKAHLVDRFYAVNYGPRVATGCFELLTAESLDLLNLASAAEKFAGKVRVPAKWIRAQGAIPDPEPGDELVGGGVADDDPMTDEPPPGAPPPDGGDQPNDAPPPDGGDQQPADEPRGAR